MDNAANISHPIRTSVLILGAGPGGICTGVKLQQVGFDSFLILEREREAGGTWVNNRYPGLSCDVPSALYSFTFDKKPDWTRAYAQQPEIKSYMQSCVDKYDLTRHIVFGTNVRQAVWDDANAEWSLHTTDGRVFVAPIFISALGMFNEVRWPEIAGIDDFSGEKLHTAAWPASADLTGKRVAVIGTAATAVQLMPKIAPLVKHLTVLQRTPNWIFPKDDPIYSPSELAERRADPDRARTRWDDQYALWESLITFENQEMIEALRGQAMALLEAVENPEVREKLRPTTILGSQRPLFSSDYYPLFNRSNVELVTAPIERITKTGVQCADGRAIDADALVFATGYAANKFLSVIDVRGRGGESLAQAWSDGPQAYLGMTVAGFPNLFMLYGPNTNNGSILYMLELQARYIVDKLVRLESSGADSIEVRGEVMDRYNAELQAHLRTTVWRNEGSKYYRSDSGRIVTQWPWTMAMFKARLEAPDPEAFVMRSSSSEVGA
ncbi:cation diffusion facilitator CzcD-associated flavoprotein CzcO [Panacagrimonas perspica]|uniref:Cation diffusion facilitator CzcD-associated flavoprotein CzcO n=1 Tax=Panacagrimonas perspica TaxID=381431 RepID=A0A4R7PGZ9_9GAMM|nr:NAD(P)/FAD-dependent oxidoreductase [Panacagrimonas perspica]TDU32690.1 cation diffusion facilitator CzcD-associated flavoprotein CzcO [Panacagrimonas perspica]THD05575.1 hypothetical protein B1810_02330 [Panacagrimonas perspica]